MTVTWPRRLSVSVLNLSPAECPARSGKGSILKWGHCPSDGAVTGSRQLRLIFQEAALAFSGHFTAELEAVASRGKAFLTEFQTLSVHFGDNKEEEGEEEGRERH